MPDKLTKVDVYVPVADGLYEIGHTRYGFDCNADRLPGVYVLTPAQLVMLLAEYKEGPLGLTEFCNHKEIPI